MNSIRNAVALLAAATALDASAAAGPTRYRMDPVHTYVSFEAPHIAAISYWRGKFVRTKGGEVVLDRAGKTGSVEVTIDASSVDVGMEKLNEHIRSKDFLDVANFPTANYKGTIQFTGDTPSSVNGELTLHGVTKPVMLTINSLKCVPDMMLQIERCGADVSGKINRTDFGVNYAAPATGSDVRLQIQVEGLIETQ
ncbi:MAG TPA: YceI family protein [Burkholderiaceae bacterium]|jgi:polyisoprenoid-binding protein YceI|nr:YceI family protein [Burkholderiaceae bacterium]